MGREFIGAFEKWADHYDQTVAGEDPEYREVFKSYDSILEETAKQARGTVLEFGTGTGNLTQKLIDRKLIVFGIEPSQNMRRIALEKIPGLAISDGDFLDFPDPGQPIDTIISTFAFHHLTADEKDRAVKKYHAFLADHGRIVFADTLFDSELEKRRIRHWANEKGYFHLLKDLQTEYYPLRSELHQIFRRHHFVPYFKQLNQFAWLIIAEKTNV